MKNGIFTKSIKTKKDEYKKTHPPNYLFNLDKF